MEKDSLKTQRSKQFPIVQMENTFCTVRTDRHSPRQKIVLLEKLNGWPWQKVEIQRCWDRLVESEEIHFHELRAQAVSLQSSTS